MLWKSIYPYVYIGHWEKFNGTSIPEKEDFYSHLNMEDITDADYIWGWSCPFSFSITINMTSSFKKDQSKSF